MFCPRCGHEASSDRVRFCTKCRFPVGSMKELIEAANYEPGDEKKSPPARQVDIIVGAALMIVGVIISMITSMAFTNKFLFAGLVAFLSVFLSIFTLFLWFSKRSPRRRGLNLGATLVLFFNLIATIFANQTDGVSWLIVGAIAVPLILLWTRIMRFFFDVDTNPGKSSLTSEEQYLNADISMGSALPLAQGHTTAELNKPRRVAEEANEPFSVTENTTDFLVNKLP